MKVESASGIHGLEALETFLASDRVPPRAITLSAVDGLLTAIAVGPETIPPSEWLAAIWGGESPAFASPDEADAVIGAVMTRFNEIIRVIDEDPFSFALILWEDADGRLVAGDWAMGFLAGMRLRFDAWGPLLDDDAGPFLNPILGLCVDENGERMPGIDDHAAEAFATEAPRVIPICAVAIREFWMARREPQTPGVRAFPKVGRNEPCPCGSRRKFKRCGGAG